MKNLKIICWVLCILLAIVGAAGVIIHFTGGSFSQTSSKALTVKIGGRVVSDNSKGFVIDDSFSLVVSPSSGYKINIVPRSGADFVFLLDGESRSFSSLTTLTYGFDISKVEGNVTLSPKGGVREIFDLLFPLYEVELPVDLDLCSELFCLVVSYDDQTTRINFAVNSNYVRGIGFDKSEVVF